MIRSFATKETELLFRSQPVGRLRYIENAARRKLLMLHAATRLEELKSQPGNRLERLGGDRAGQCSIRINDRWRICFTWRPDGAYDVEIVDYH
ncbi:type II toxin-antitoxin system RelE/ParE family toxin [Pseudoduganella namucuonensis]|uniref:type II toxin-antitoxin system RelE/ParE family toxin n=1 Tax=Pseudoduganella namucuonensis TaxID=1035707 RepID=UPI000B84248C|nr:type II toxin-antitoxin system RelE/ParE family toxin [Pseudoduganella namucuonensis]